MGSNSHNLSYIQDFPIPLGYSTHEAYYFYNDNDQETFDAYDLFRFYNIYFFHNILEASQVKWSSRMTLCAGTCQLQAPGSCLITLSKPLLQYRSNNELKETLIHEMIHGYLFITNPKACRENGGHGVEFCEIMKNINAVTGLNITVYHSFHDEVDYFRKHIWKCNGPCQQRKPYYGLVKRAMNRAPGPKDLWWKQHEKECGGQYTKIDGPEFHPEENKKQKTKKRKPTGPANTLNDFFKKTKKSDKQEQIIEIEDSDAPKVFIFLLSDEEGEQRKSAIKKPERVQEEQILKEEIPEKEVKKKNSKIPEKSDSMKIEKKIKTKHNNNNSKENTNRKSGTLFDFLKKVVHSEEENSSNKIFEDFSSDKIVSPRKTLIEKGLTLSTNENSQMVIENDSFSPQNLYETSNSRSNYIYSVLIKRDEWVDKEKFWMRILINPENSFSSLLKISDLVSLPKVETGRLIFIKEKQIIFFNKSLVDMSLNEGSTAEDKSNGIIFKFEKFFSLENAKNINIIKAQHFPVCVSIALFKEDGSPEEDCKERVDNINDMLINMF